MIRSHYAEVAGRVLRGLRAWIAPAHVAPPTPTVHMLAKAIRGSAARRRRRRALLTGATATFGVVVVALALRLPWLAESSSSRLAGAPTFVRPNFVALGSATARLTGSDGKGRALIAGEVWRAGDLLQSGSDELELRTPDGSSVSMAARSELQLIRSDNERWLRLSTGTVQIHVAKLQLGERFVIVTPDIEVEVRGTRFQVQVREAKDSCGYLTRVEVREGLVAVRSHGQETRVPGGRGWPEGCPEAPAAVATPAPIARTRIRSRIGPRPAAGGRAEAVRMSTLDTENDLFDSALRAERRGDRRQALEFLDLLLKTFPATPLQPSAMAARKRMTQNSSP